MDGDNWAIKTGGPEYKEVVKGDEVQFESRRKLQFVGEEEAD